MKKQISVRLAEEAIGIIFSVGFYISLQLKTAQIFLV